MRDAESKTELLFRQMMRKKSGSERLLMGCSMFDMSKSIVKSSILAAQPNIGREEMRLQLFQRFYKHDYQKEELDKILAHLKKT